MIRMRTFNESMESEREIFKLCHKLAPEIVDGFIRIINLINKKFGMGYVENEILGSGDGFTSSLFPEDVVEIYRSKFLEPFYRFIEENRLIVYVIMGDTSKRRTPAQYTKKDPRSNAFTATIKVYIDDLNFRKEVVDLFKKYNQESSIKNSFLDIFKNSRSFQTLVREFVHAYDDFISSGKY